MTVHKEHFRQAMQHGPFHSRLAAMTQTEEWTSWNGYMAPRVLDKLSTEYFAVRSSCSVMDLTPMEKYRITGPDAWRYLDRLLTRDLSKLKPWSGDSPPPLALTDLDGKPHKLSDYRGKVVYLDFWASWCAPCLKAIPEIERIRAELPSDSFQVVAINLDQKTKSALRFLKKHPIGYPSASDPKGRLPNQFGLETMPTSYLIDANGVIRYVHPGFKKGDGSKLRREIRALLAK